MVAFFSIALRGKKQRFFVVNCHSILRSKCSVILAPTILVTLPNSFWTATEIRCGDPTVLFSKHSRAFCWDCARENHLVDENEQKYLERGLGYPRRG